MECLPFPDENECAFGLYCDAPTKSCAIGCATDADCGVQGEGPLVCDVASHQCIQCGTGAACPPGSKCELSTGACVPGCDQSAECPSADWECCLQKCKNVTKDLANCGACEEPCTPEQSTAWLCLDGGCVFQSCLPGWASCDQNQSEGNGCEVDTLSDPLNCGRCDNPCSLANAVEGCENSTCTIEACESGFGNCDGKVATGCETDLASDVDHCGGCGLPCPPFDHGTPECAAASCALVGCDAGFGDCDGNEANGCETSTTDSTQHCGACGAGCLLDNAAATCFAGECAVVVCDLGFEDCNGLAGDGCEVNLLVDAEHCGTCEIECTYAHATATCNQGTCAMGACDPGFANCNDETTDGCETNTNTSVGDCGGCGDVCSANNAVATCAGGECQLMCNAGFEDCDALPSNGCETSTTNSVDHCGSCATTCPADGGTPYCFQSTCGVSNCAPGTGNCDGNPVNGCEVALGSPTNCGTCGNVCSSTNGSPSCAGGTCTISCSTGYGNCNGNVADGCEQALSTNMHCTACGVPCTRPHAFTSCGTGACLIVSCEQGWADCNNNASDGCEIHLTDSESHCGACGSPCAPANALGICSDGVCSIQSCTGEFENCNGGVADGCEVNTNTSQSHCGGCGDTCSLPNAATVCTGGVCEVASCNGAFEDCDGSDLTGCEANTQNSLAHCGACGNVCAAVNGTPSCAAGQCAINCTSGFKNCNSSTADGCETSIQTLASCGDCGVACNLANAAETCATGTCQIVSCNAPFTNCDQSTTNGCECAASCVGGICQGCGDGSCQGGLGETCNSCPADCGGCCGNAFCDAALGETCSNCAADCGGCGPVCGDTICNGSETCSTCAIDCGGCCGNGACEAGLGETCQTCASDCAACCGDGTCEAALGETCATCSQDCGQCPAELCDNGVCAGSETCMSCPEDCGPCGSGSGGGG